MRYKITFGDLLSQCVETRETELTDKQYQKAINTMLSKIIVVDRLINQIHFQFIIKSIKKL